jgi:hypothetical protein
MMTLGQGLHNPKGCALASVVVMTMLICTAKARAWSGVKSGLKPIYREVSHGPTYSRVYRA